MKDTVNIVINDKEYTVKKGITVLEAARKEHIDIPTLCYLKDINENASCRMCLVKVSIGDGPTRLTTSCTLKVQDNMKIITNDKEIMDARKINLELILSNHDKSCLSCNKNGNCELQKLCEIYKPDEYRFKGESNKYDIDYSSPSIVRDNNKCIKCGRCVSVCKNIQGVSAIAPINRGFTSIVSTPFNEKLANTNCINCGQCIKVCPTGALSIKNDTELVLDMIDDETKHVVVQTAPSVRVALGEEFGIPNGTNVTKKMVGALKSIGFNKVFDTDFSADLTIVEEANELIERMKNIGPFPMFTSCCPAWVLYIEENYPEFINNLSTCKSPQGMMGSVINNYYAKKNNIDKQDLISVSIMPCTAKKYEARRKELNNDVDIVLTTVELAELLKLKGIDLKYVEESEYDPLFGTASGAGDIFGVSGGVMEAALRTAYERITNTTLEKLDFQNVRGLDNIKEADININGSTLKVAIASSLSAAKVLLEEIKQGKKMYHFIEVMACPGGCINGGGQPVVSNSLYNDIKKVRSDALYNIDKEKKLRKSHENPMILSLYNNFLDNPGSHTAHELLHTTYKNRKES